MRTRVLVSVLCWFHGRFRTKSCCPTAVWKEAACSWVLLACCSSHLPPPPFLGRLGPWPPAPPAKHRCPLWVFSSCGPTVKSWANLGFSVTSRWSQLRVPFCTTLWAWMAPCRGWDSGPYHLPFSTLIPKMVHHRIGARLSLWHVKLLKLEDVKPSKRG